MITTKRVACFSLPLDFAIIYSHSVSVYFYQTTKTKNRKILTAFSLIFLLFLKIFLRFFTLQFSFTFQLLTRFSLLCFLIEVLVFVCFYCLIWLISPTHFHHNLNLSRLNEKFSTSLRAILMHNCILQSQTEKLESLS